MALLSRLYTFTAATLIQSAQVNGELDQIIDLLAGTSVNKSAEIHFNGASPATLVLNNTGGGPIASFEVSGTEKALVNASGQLESTIATGTPPLVVASTTEVANLNAALINGVAGSSLIKDNTNNQNIAPGADPAALRITSTGNEAKLELYEALGNGIVQTAGGRLILESDDGTDGMMVLLTPGSGTLTVANASQHPYPGEIATQPWVTAQDYQTGAQVDAKVVIWSKEWLLTGIWAASTKVFDILLPTDTEVEIDRVRYVYRTGTPSGNSTLNLVHYNSSGVAQATYGLTINSTDNQNQTYEINLADFTPAAGDYLRLEPVSNGGHTDLTIAVHGHNSLVD